MPLIRCPDFGEHEALRRVDHEQSALLVECTACGHRWKRDLTLRCGRCGSEELDPVLTTTLEEAGRGEQRTPSGLRRTYRCRSCGARNATSSSPRPPDPDSPVDHTARRERATRRSPPAVEPRARHRIDSAFGTFQPGVVVGGRRRAYVASARAVGRVAHPGLLAVNDVREREGDVLIVGELAGTRTLVDLPEADRPGSTCRRSGPRSPGRWPRCTQPAFRICGSVRPRSWPPETVLRGWSTSGSVAPARPCGRHSPARI